MTHLFQISTYVRMVLFMTESKIQYIFRYFFTHKRLKFIKKVKCQVRSLTVQIL